MKTRISVVGVIFHIFAQKTWEPSFLIFFTLQLVSNYHQTFLNYHHFFLLPWILECLDHHKILSNLAIWVHSFFSTGRSWTRMVENMDSISCLRSWHGSSLVIEQRPCRSFGLPISAGSETSCLLKHNESDFCWMSEGTISPQLWRCHN